MSGHAEAYSNAMGIFKEHLSRTNPEAWQMLKTPSVGFNFTPEAFVYYFLEQDRERWERLSKPPFVDFWLRQQGRSNSI
jgi:hypothetical protein